MDTKGNDDGTGSGGVLSIKILYVQARMSKMASGTLFFRTDHIDTPFKNSIKSSLQVFLEVIPVILMNPLSSEKPSSIEFRSGELWEYLPAGGEAREERYCIPSRTDDVL